jgi:peptide/nickel transport system permease protein
MVGMRFLDGLAVLFWVSVATFAMVRMDLSIVTWSPWPIIVLFLAAFGGLAYLPVRRNLWRAWPIAAVAVLVGIAKLFPSLSQPAPDFGQALWRHLVCPLLMASLLVAYGWRSYRSRSKLLLSTSGLLVLLAFVHWVSVGLLHADSWPPVEKYEPPLIIKSGDPLADLKLNPSVNPEALEREKQRLGLDKSMPEQYFRWLDGLLLRGDLGLTQDGQPVADVVWQPLRNTVALNLLVVAGAWLLAVPLGVLAAVYRDRWLDRTMLTLSSLSMTTPSFLLAIFVLAVAVKLGMNDVGGLTSLNHASLSWPSKVWDILAHMLLPAAILVFVSIGGLIRQMRGNLLDVLEEDYILAARARGIPEMRIFWLHAVPNAINPLITLLGFEFAALISGAALTEMILAYPGIGALTLEAARKMDINLIMFNLLLGTTMLLLGNGLADWLLARVDPRTRSVGATA